MKKGLLVLFIMATLVMTFFLSACGNKAEEPAEESEQEEDGSYTVTSMDTVEDGGGFDESAKELFGEYYDDFMKVYSDEKAREELRTITVSDYVNLNGLDVDYYQDEGQDPVKLYKQ